MTETEWETTRRVCSVMLPLLKERKIPSTKGGRRKLRLYTAGVCRLAWALLGPSDRAAVELMERVADGSGSDQDLKQTLAALTEENAPIPDYAQALLDAPDKRNAAVYASLVVRFSLMRPAYEGAYECSRWALDIPGRLAHGDSGFMRLSKECRAKAARAHAEILREVFGNPFRPLPAANFPVSVRSVAESAYQSQDPTEYQILADVLEEHGRLELVLGPAWLEGHSGLYLPIKHLRHLERPHVKGCHVLDWARGVV